MIDDPVPALKRQLAAAILRLAARTNVYVAARALGIDIARMSDLRHGREGRFSIERLIRMLAAADRRVELTVVAEGPDEILGMAKLRAKRDARRQHQTHSPRRRPR